MSQFYGSMQGGRGEATRCGTKNSGMVAHIRGWDIGAKVICFHENGKDIVRVYKTGGSKMQQPTELIAEITE